MGLGLVIITFLFEDKDSWLPGPGAPFGGSRDLLTLFCSFPVVIYSNADTLKEVVIKSNRKKCGIYKWTNIKSGKSYVGSSIDLGRRFKAYYTTEGRLR
jgi:hypothetical protein